MGIKNLFKLIKTYAPNSIKYKNITDYKGKFIVLDAHMVIYQYVIAIRNTGNDLQNKEGKLTSHILGVISKAQLLLKNNIIPIFVFDGKAPVFKKKTLNKRKVTKEKNKKKLDTCEEKDKIKYFKRSYTLKKEQINECKQILKLFGIPVITSSTEADPLCAWLVKNNLAYGVATEDMDLLTFGSNKLIRKLKNGKKNSIIEITLSDVLKELKLNINEFIDLCILLGSDYLPTIKKIGFKRAYEIIQKYKTLNNFINNDPKVKSKFYEIPDDYNYEIIHKYFLKPSLKTTKLKIQLQKPKINKIKKIMIDTYDFKSNKVDQFINKSIKFYEKITQK